MPLGVSTTGVQGQNNGQLNRATAPTQNNGSAIDSLPSFILTQIFEFAAINQTGMEATSAIRLTCKKWGNVNDNILLSQWFDQVKVVLGKCPFFQSISSFQNFENANSGQPKHLEFFKDLSRALNEPNLLFPEQYLRSYQELEDQSLVTVWNKIGPQINFGDELIPIRPEEIRNWINNPENAARIQTITQLNLQFMNLKLLPPEIGAFVNLQQLDLRNNQLKSLPENIGNLQQLRELSLENNQLESLPETFGNLQQLEVLFLNYNQLKNLPETFGNLQQLKVLFLENNQLKSLPETFGNLQQLQGLTLSINQLKSLPEAFGNLQQLQRLTLGNNQLKSLPESFGNLQQLTELSLCSNQLKSLPESFGNLGELRILFLNNNQLKSLPENIGNLQQLQVLFLNNNQLKSLPETFGNLQQLQGLTLSNNQLKSLPEAFGNFQQLKRLTLGNNQLKSLPESFGNLQQLTDLSLNNNQLKSLPESFGNLQQLGKLYLNNNQLKSLPKSFGNLGELIQLNLDNNLCIFMFNKELSKTSTTNSTQRILEKYRACKEYAPRTPFARLCQLIHNQADKDLLEPTLCRMPRAMQAQIRSKIEDIWVSLPEHQEVENKELLKANAVRAVCHERVEILNRAIIEILKDTFSAFTEDQKHLVYDNVWVLAGRPHGDNNWGENHAEDNIIRLIDAVAIMLSEQGNERSLYSN